MPGRPASLAIVLLVAAWTAGCGSGGDAAPPPSRDGEPPAVARYGRPVLLGRLDPPVDESSGLAASRRNPGLFWTHNDSGDAPVVHCADDRAGSCGTFRLTGATARDWEGMAVGPGPQEGRGYLYLGDIGDNLQDQDQVSVYRVPEPAVPTSGAPAAIEPAERIRLRYADGPRDAEALLVHPVSGDVYVVTKERSSAGVYKAGGDGVLRRIATLAVDLGPVTGGDISPDGRRVALCTYSAGFELELPAAGTAGFDDVWRQPLRPVELPPRAQGEAIAYRADGNALLTTSEGVPAPLHQMERRHP